VAEDAEKFKPVGEKIHEYTRPGPLTAKENQNSKFEIYLADFKTPGMREHHKQMQLFLLFLIEASSYIDDTDELWQVMTLYEKRKVSTGNKRVGQFQYFFVGYVTLYNFLAFPELKKKLRVSQFIILPPYQRRGHGQELLRQIYEIARNEESFIETNVEDPSPSFQFMRDLIDLQDCLSFGFYNPVRKRDGKCVPVVYCSECIV